jgi:hypothetical protein
MRRMANVFMSLGAVIGVLGCIGLAVGFRPSQLPAGLLDLSVYKLIFVAAAGVIAAGAILGRAARRGERDAAEATETPRQAELQTGGRPDELPHADVSRERMRRDL